MPIGRNNDGETVGPPGWNPRPEPRDMSEPATTDSTVDAEFVDAPTSGATRVSIMPEPDKMLDIFLTEARRAAVTLARTSDREALSRAHATINSLSIAACALAGVGDAALARRIKTYQDVICEVSGITHAALQALDQTEPDD